MTDTIAAVGTPPGAGAIAIVRVSGPDAIRIADLVFRGAARLSDAEGYSVHYGHALDAKGSLLDEVLATVFRLPRSFTGEDMVEISCHGGSLVTRLLMESVIAAGARAAGPGEFTRRAFLNGRIDLSQAEAVADLIAARSRRGQSISLGHLEGRLGKLVQGLRKEVLDLCALLELTLDFSEEGLDLITREDLAARLNGLAFHIDTLASSYEQGRLYRDGVSVVLAGEPNAGKSSLFNALLKQDRAIVTAVPGTTRDALEESILIEGILFRLTDTAGLRETSDHVEQLGVERSRAAMTKADIVLHVMDAEVSPSVQEHLERMAVHQEGQHFLPVLNKCDVLEVWPPERSAYHREDAGEGGAASTAQAVGQSWVAVSAKTGRGLDELRTAVARLVTSSSSFGEEDMCITNIRHKECLSKSASCLKAGRNSLESGASQEYIAFDVREAASALSEITGEVTSEELLNHIFSRFCIGK
ncbi:MAG: tRNA uridine-5-carboxymethylaminomethyl(34) synthesis GTPase MnmE [Bacteroidetes bacterium]|nr:tRNA uridine-5-carboxymethylaminomethyl(34) synthesis GTPase MnmE [Bacteroidota bacterium]